MMTMEMIYEVHRDEQWQITGQTAMYQRSVFNLAHPVHGGALTAAIMAALPGKMVGVSDGAAENAIFVFLTPSALPADEATATGIVMAHDPVFITCDKTQIKGNGIETTTVTVRAPKNGAVAVVLSMTVNGKPAPDWTIPLVDGVGTDTLTTPDRCVIGISVKNGANRNNDVLRVRAV